MPTIYPAPLKALTDIGSTAVGLYSESFPATTAANQVAPTSQLIYATAVPVRAGATITNIHVIVTTASSGTAPTTIKLALLDSAFKVLDKGLNLNSDAAWTTTGPKTIALQAPVVIGTDTVVYPCFLQDGSFSVTQPQFLRDTVVQTTAMNAIGTGVRRAAAQAGQTDYASLAGTQGLSTLTATSILWFGIS